MYIGVCYIQRLSVTSLWSILYIYIYIYIIYIVYCICLIIQAICYLKMKRHERGAKFEYLQINGGLCP